VRKVNGVQVADLVNAGLVTKQRAVLPLKVTVPFYAARWTARKIWRLLLVLARVWPVSAPLLAGLVLWARFGWPGPVLLAAGLVASGAVWARTHPASFRALVTCREPGPRPARRSPAPVHPAPSGHPRPAQASVQRIHPRADVHRPEERYDGDRIPVWDPRSGDGGAGGFVDPDTGTPLPTWDEALDTISGDDADPAHVVRFGTQTDAEGVLAGTPQGHP
jgi:hypothetical protein